MTTANNQTQNSSNDLLTDYHEILSNFMRGEIDDEDHTPLHDVLKNLHECSQSAQCDTCGSFTIQQQIALIQKLNRYKKIHRPIKFTSATPIKSTSYQIKKESKEIELNTDLLQEIIDRRTNKLFLSIIPPIPVTTGQTHIEEKKTNSLEIQTQDDIATQYIELSKNIKGSKNKEHLELIAFNKAKYIERIQEYMKAIDLTKISKTKADQIYEAHYAFSKKIRYRIEFKSRLQNHFIFNTK